MASGPDEEEVEEVIEDGGSVQAARYHASRPSRPSASAAHRKPQRKRAAPREEEALLRRPSERRFFNAWRERGDADWRPEDVVGYFVCRYRELRGEEPREFFVTNANVMAPGKQAFNVRRYAKRWLDGDYRRARALVDEILAGAEERGMPVKLGYFFTPASEATAQRLREPARRGRKEEPWQRNDARGHYESNREYWAQRKRENEELMAKAKRVKVIIPESPPPEVPSTTPEQDEAEW